MESAKFDQQKDEFMDVEGEVEVDVDMMKELRLVLDFGYFIYVV